MGPSIRFVLLRPRIAENVGAVARALKNFGWDDWIVVDPQISDWSGAQRMAVQSHDLLARRQDAPSLGSAVADCHWVVGTSSRRLPGRPRMTPREVAERAASEESVAIVFGDERSGLTNEDLTNCHALSGLPTTDDQPSVNLAQAVLLYAYELRLATQAQPASGPAPRARAATHDELQQLEATLGVTLTEGGFLKSAGRHALDDLYAPWLRARLSQKEQRLWMAALKTLQRRL